MCLLRAEPHTMSSDLALCPSAKPRTGLALDESLVDSCWLSSSMSAIQSSPMRVQVLQLARQQHVFSILPQLAAASPSRTE